MMFDSLIFKPYFQYHWLHTACMFIFNAIDIVRLYCLLILFVLNKNIILTQLTISVIISINEITEKKKAIRKICRY